MRSGSGRTNQRRDRVQLCQKSIDMLEITLYTGEVAGALLVCLHIFSSCINQPDII
jgi:hypothetical protein